MPKISVGTTAQREVGPSARPRKGPEDLRERSIRTCRVEKPKILTCPTATGTKISERSNSAVPEGIRARFLWLASRPAVNSCERLGPRLSAANTPLHRDGTGRTDKAVSL